MYMKTIGQKDKSRVSVIVLGDFGRSPRMQYHTWSLSKHNFIVDVVAYKGSDPLQQISRNENIHFHYLQDVPKILQYLPGVFRYVMKTIWQSIFLFLMLINIPKMNCILLQNPPSIPTLPVACFICWLRSCCLVIDFHNYGYTILGLTTGRRSLLVKIATWCEKYFSCKADKSICVTQAMKTDLMENWNVRASVFYDCAPDIFHPISIEEKHSFFWKLSKDIPQFVTESVGDGNEKSTRFTKMLDSKCEMQSKRPALIVSSTSWTEDEDFSVLLAALKEYEDAANVRKNLPHLLVAITGKGPLKSYYETQIQEEAFSHIEIITLWLKSEDYPTFLACADLGVCLHSSSSGLDLPMKVVDMFGCCLPVCALSFKCLDELIKDGINGRIFSNSHELSLQLQTLLNGFPSERTQISTFRENLSESGSLRWDQNWNHTVFPIFQELLNKN